MAEELAVAAAARCRRPELMDQPGLDAPEHARALAGLRRINRVSRSAAMYWPEVRRFAKDKSDGALRVLDLACGGGDVPIALARRARRSRLDLSIEGCDRSLEATQIAREQALLQNAPVRFFTLDALKDEIPSGYDVVISSLFLHHLAEHDAVELLVRMARAAAQGILINDLVRGPIEYALAWLGCRVLSSSPIVRHDGPVSVRAAFTIPEVRALARQAGLDSARLTRHWPGRFLLSWSRR
jgi:2-polyprenyl-3-methyl-5-hydroxy-6-metoxy-1,4-benzoquinol methylase